ncbi:hypothetical protein AALO_G00043890 [Alosa alosa]|uniref:Ashwin n=1 Tax=Alosa alosa TaxID=278164 RepID=A0AAV6HDN4_9TELE|nr:ashwin isoform X1 [Alosa alosa]KAG5283601.1 hypothetical protein AALO_G00043890 [Alosa alosa]
MANHRHGRDHGKEKKSDEGPSVVDLLLHPELLSKDFMKLILHERNIQVDSDGSQDQLRDLYMRHVIPLPQRELPKSRWGKKMQKTRVEQRSSQSHGYSSDTGRKRPLIVFDGSSTGSVKIKKPDTLSSPGATDRLKPPPSMNMTNPIRKLSGSSSNSSVLSSSSSSSSSSTITPKSPSGPPSSEVSNSATANLKRPGDSDCSGELSSPDVKKKIQHVTWP